MTKCDKFCFGKNFHSAWDPNSLSIERMVPFSNCHSCVRLHDHRCFDDYYYTTRKAFLGNTLRNHTLALLTAPRPASTIQDTFKSLDRAGDGRWFGPKFIFSDGPFFVSDCRINIGWKIFDNLKTLGCARSFIDLLIRALINDPRLQYLTIIEDDVELSKNALFHMSRIQIPDDVAFLSWFTYPYDWSSPKHRDQSQELIEKSKKYPILGIRPSRYFILTQTITLPRRTIDRLLMCPKITTYWPRSDGMDEMIAYALGDEPYATYFPGLVQHMGGLNSAVSMQQGSLQSTGAQSGERKSPYYMGSDFDCLSFGYLDIEKWMNEIIESK